MTTAALYVRVSTRHQAEEGFSLEEQQRVLTELAERRGWSFRLYVDAGLSGEGIDHRPEMLRLLADAEAGALDVVAVVDESRLARDEFTAAFIRHQLKQAEVMLSTPTGDRDLTDPADAYIAGILGLGAAFEQGRRTEKTTAGLRATATAGFWPGGPAPFGYRLERDPAGSKHKVPVVDEGEAATIREAVALILDHGHTTWTAAKVLNARDLVTRSGRPWHFRNLSYQLQREHLTGRFTYNHRTGPVDIEVPAILAQSRWDAIQAIIRAVPGSRQANRFYPLSGHLTCACGATITGIYRKGRDARYYKCSRTLSYIDPEDRCPHYPRYLPADQIETQVWDAIYDLLSDPERLRAAAEHHIAAATKAEPQQRNQRAAIARRLDELDLEETGVIRTHARGQISDQQLAATLDQITDERASLRGHLGQLDLWEQRSRQSQAQLAQLHQIARDARTRLAEVSPQQQRRIYELLQLAIRVTPERTLDIIGSIPTRGTLNPDETSGQLSAKDPRDP